MSKKQNYKDLVVLGVTLLVIAPQRARTGTRSCGRLWQVRSGDFNCTIYGFSSKSGYFEVRNASGQNIFTGKTLKVALEFIAYQTGTVGYSSCQKTAESDELQRRYNLWTAGE